MPDARALIHTALCEYRMTNMAEEGEPTSPYPLVDLCSNPGASIDTGKAALFDLADHLWAVLSDAGALKDQF